MNDITKLKRRATSPQEALETLQTAVSQVMHEVNSLGYPNGDFTCNIVFTGRIDAVENLKCTVELQHYHYGKFENYSIARGVEWNEVVNELSRLLKRDQSLKRLTHQTE